MIHLFPRSREGRRVAETLIGKAKLMKRHRPDSVERRSMSTDPKTSRVRSGRVRTTELPSGEAVPVLGLGTWRLAEGLRPREEETAALRLGLDLGMTLIDT